MHRRDFLRKFAGGTAIGAAAPVLARLQRAETSPEDLSAVEATQLEELRKQLVQLQKKHKLLFRSMLLGLSLLVGVDIALLL